ncbi:GNAT family N-acetyltransferase [bacterium]|nr:GNAT family N-acetyltransferase [bacterium]
MIVEYRDIKMKDEPVLWDMLYLALYVSPGQPSFSRKILKDPSIARYVAGWGRAGDEGLLAYAGDKILGAIWIRLWPEDADKGFGFVSHKIPEVIMAVLPEHRGLGVGTTLLDKLISQAQVRYSALSLSVAESNSAQHLYKRFGFVSVEKTSDAYIMVKRFC